MVFAGLFIFIESRAKEPVIPLMLFKNRNFNLTTGAGLMVGIAMFGAIGYMPTYLQMVTGANATEAGMLMIPMMGGLLLTSVISGRVVSRSGKYKAFPIVGSLVMAVGLGCCPPSRSTAPPRCCAPTCSSWAPGSAW